MNIRPATEADVDGIVAMSAKFYATTSYRTFASMDEETVADLVRTLIDTGVMLVAEDAGELVGMAGLFVAPFMFNRQRTAAYEVVWWVNPSDQGAGAGKGLLVAIDAACRAKGCAIVQMVTLSTSPPQAAAIYERMGYAHSETSYTKVLD
jgi:GNAT superfamily N-acetyltransferase